MFHTRASALVAFEVTLHRLNAQQRDPNAWEEANLLQALAAITAGEYDAAVESIAAAARPPTAAEVSHIQRRDLLTRAKIRDRFDDLKKDGSR